MNTLADPLFEIAAHAPERIAIIHRGRAVTYAELAQRVSARAAALRRRGIGHGDRVLVFVPMSIPLYEILLAVFHVGAAAVFIDAWAGARRIDHAAALAECKGFIGIPRAFLLLLVSRALRRIPVKLLPSFGRHATSEDQPNGQVPSRPNPPDTPALITFTTGSTGVPKAALRTVGFLLEQLRVLRAELRIGEGDVDLATLPIFVLANLACGATTLLPDFNPAKPADFNAARVRAEAAERGVTTTAGSPAFYERLLEGAPPGEPVIPTLRRLHVGGAAVWPDFAARLCAAFPDADVRALYGSTEAEPIAGIGADELAACTEMAGGVPAGVPSPFLRLAVIPIGATPPDRELTTEEWDALSLPEGEPGELCVAGPHVLKTYFRNDTAMRENKIRVAGDVWHRTGDAGRLAGGRLFLLGRSSRAFRDANGVWCFPMLIEARLRAIPGIAAGTVLRLLDGRLAAAIEPDGSVPEASLPASIADADVPHDFVQILPALPRDPRHRSKIDYGALVVKLEQSLT
jgi:acyl-CoA synthetase (AMP-forming)/AMP-acid ligase II